MRGGEMGPGKGLGLGLRGWGYWMGGLAGGRWGENVVTALLVSKGVLDILCGCEFLVKFDPISQRDQSKL